MKPAPVRFIAEAEQEVREARSWYSQRSPSAAQQFQKELDAAVQRIAEAPERWPKYRQGTQRCRLHRFPYLLVYRMIGTDVVVLACQHAHRRPGYWVDRLQ